MEEYFFLIVDDDEVRLKTLKTSMAAMGYKNVEAAAGGDNAWVLLKSKHIDCVISSYDMQEMSGLALLKIIRREDSLGTIPFFLADPAFTKLKVLKAGQTGVTGLFVLPFDQKRIHKKILAALTNKKEVVIEKAEETFNKAITYMENKQFDKALTVFNSLVTQKENPEYYFNIGYIKTAQGKHTEAIEAFSKATQLDRLFAKAYEEIGKIYKLLGDLDQAEQFIQQAAEIYMDTDKLGSAEGVLNELLESGTDSLNVFNTLGVIYRKKGETDTALSQYKKALKVHPDEPYIYYNIGRLYLDMKDHSQAKKYFTQALDHDHEFEEAREVIKAIDLGLV